MAATLGAAIFGGAPYGGLIVGARPIGAPILGGPIVDYVYNFSPFSIIGGPISYKTQKIGQNRLAIILSSILSS